MGNSSSNSNKIYNSVYNNFLSVNQNECYAVTSNQIIGNSFTLECLGTCDNISVANIGGNINTYCSVSQQLSQSAVTSLSSQLEQQAKIENDLFNDGLIYSQTKNKSDINQTSVSNIVNINSNTCNAETYNVIANNVFDLSVNNSKNIDVMSISADQNTKCNIDNLVKQESSNSLRAAAKQKATVVGMFALLFSGLITVMIIFVIGIVIIFAGGSIAKVVTSSKKEESNKKDTKNTQNINKDINKDIGYSLSQN